PCGPGAGRLPLGAGPRGGAAPRDGRAANRVARHRLSRARKVFVSPQSGPSRAPGGFLFPAAARHIPRAGKYDVVTDLIGSPPSTRAGRRKARPPGGVNPTLHESPGHTPPTNPIATLRKTIRLTQNPRTPPAPRTPDYGAARGNEGNARLNRANGGVEP